MLLRCVSSETETPIPKIKGSRFIGYLAPASNEAAALAFVEDIRTRHPNATHWVYAWRIDPETTKSTDDGEPSGTAGKPLLDRLVGHELEQTVLVVVRYYGGTKLGTGGLVRAYGGCASAAIDAAVITEREERSVFSVEVTPKLEGPVRGVVLGHSAEVVEVKWGATIHMTISVVPDQAEPLRTAIRDRTAGSARFTETVTG